MNNAEWTTLMAKLDRDARVMNRIIVGVGVTMALGFGGALVVVLLVVAGVE